MYFFSRENTSPTATLKSPYPTLSLPLSLLSYIFEEFKTNLKEEEKIPVPPIITTQS